MTALHTHPGRGFFGDHRQCDECGKHIFTATIKGTDQTMVLESGVPVWRQCGMSLDVTPIVELVECVAVEHQCVLHFVMTNAERRE